MSKQLRLRDLADLRQLLPESAEPALAKKSKSSHDGKGNTVRVSRDTKDRRGKVVTVVSGLQHNPDTMEEIARILKQFCGAGGTVKEGTIEIQGNHGKKVSEKLEEMNYVVIFR